MRRTSVSLPTRNAAYDPHEKPGRYNTKGARISAVGTLEKIKAAWMTQSQRSRYLKTGGILLFVFFVFYYFSSSGTDAIRNVTNVGNIGGQTADGLAGTTKCSKSSDKSKPLIQYALMLDAGSSGSRIHVYKFNNCGSSPELESEVFEYTKGENTGLSSYGDDVEGAAKSLDFLMDVAVKKVPDAYKSCTPVAVKATAGLRLLGEEKSAKILDAVRTRLETQYPFPVVSKENNGVVIMDGKDEGVYAWITTNYLLGKIGGPDISPTAAVFDLGGGSTQIVFEPTFKGVNGGMPDKLAEGDHKYELTFGGRNFELYQHSHLGYGLNAARDTIYRTMFEDLYTQNAQSSPDQAWLNQPITNPCVAPGMNTTVTIKLTKGHQLGESVTVNMAGPKTPAPAQCRKLAENILIKDKECALAPCSFNGVHQPALEKTFAREDVYIFSYFFDRTYPLGMPESFTLRELHHLTEQVCGGESSWDVFESVPGALEKLRKLPDYCLDLNFMGALLHTGYEMPIDREVKIAKKIKENELGWCLGASLPLLAPGSGWKCKVKEVA